MKPSTELETAAERIGDDPLISVILAVRNEQRHIEKVLNSILHQKTSGWELEVIVVDGNSSDDTQAIVTRIGSVDRRVRLLVNKFEKTPYAFNLGIERSRGDYVCILGAHTTYAQDYIATCLDELRTHNAAGCSGRLIVRPGAEGLQARLIAWTLAHPFGTSTGSMRTRGAGFADTIPYPLFQKNTILAVGGYNTQLHRNQDNDLSQRLRACGYQLYMTDKTSCEYFVSPDFATLATYAFTAGYWNFLSLKVNPSSMSIRHFVPAVFVAVLLVSLMMLAVSISVAAPARLWLLAPALLLCVIYGAANIAIAFQVTLRERSLEALLMPFALFLLHVSYGFGTLSALMSNAATEPDEALMERDTGFADMANKP
jgi:succinoglycan biosynthesis protein ExoA